MMVDYFTLSVCLYLLGGVVSVLLIETLFKTIKVEKEERALKDNAAYKNTRQNN